MKSHFSRVMFLSLFISLVSWAFIAGGQFQDNYLPGEVIIKLTNPANPDDASAIRSALNATVARRFNSIDAELWTLSDMTVPDAVELVRDDPRVEYIEPNYIITADDLFPNDPRFPEMWGLHNIGQTGGTPDADIDAPEAWSIETGDSVLVGVIDTGVDWHHVDLADNIYTNPGEIPGNGIDDDGNGYVDDVRGWDFYNNDNDPYDDAGHGTHVAGTVAAIGDNGIGVVGVSWSAKILPIKFLGAGGSGSTSGAILSVEYATLMGVQLTNNSWGGGGYSTALRDAIEEAGDAGILFVAAAGNSGQNTDTYPHYPSSYDLDNIISVANTTHTDQLSGLSNYGLVSVDLGAPGSSILSTFPGNTYGTISGTSMATPHVSGAISLLWSAAPAMNHMEVKDVVLASVDTIPALVGRTVTGGRLNAYNMLSDLDSIPPARIDDLTVELMGSNTATLSWTATGDDSTYGTAAAYDLRYSTSQIYWSNWDDATPVPGMPSPQPSGSPESFMVTGLDFTTTYYFALVAVDEQENRSWLSNILVTGTTLGIPVLEYDPASFADSLLTGGTSIHTLTIRNVGEGTLDFVFPGADGMGPVPFPGWLDADPSSGRVWAGESFDVQFVMDATGLFAGDYSVPAIMQTNDPGNTSVPLPVSLHVTNAPDISASPDPMGFGWLYIGLTRTDTLVVTNIGTDVLTVTSLTTDNSQFVVDPGGFTLGLGASQPVPVTFVPTSDGTIAGALSIASNDPDHPMLTVGLAGEGVEPPVITVSPASLSDDLFTGGISTQTLNIGNIGGSQLDFELSIEALDGAASVVDVIADVELPGDVIQEGRPLDAGELAALKEKFPGSISVDATGAIDNGAPSVRRSSQRMEIQRVEHPLALEEIFGNDDNQFSGSNRSRGNLFTCTTSTTLIEHRLYLNPATATQMWFLVYEGTAQAGTYELVSASDVSPAGPGLGWYSSGDIDVDLLEGRYYLIIASFEQTTNYFNQQGISPYPIPASFGELTGGAGWDWAPPTSFPPASIIDVPTYAFGGPVAYYQTLVTGSAVRWLSLDPEEGAVPEMTSMDIDVTFNAAGMYGGDYEAEIVIANNDPFNSEVIVPVDLHVTGAPDIEVSETTIDYGQVFIGAHIPHTITVTNAGTDLLTINGAATDHPDYTIDVTDFALAPGASQDMVVTFSPTTVAPILGTLTIPSNDPDEPVMEIALTGEGLEPPVIVVTPGSFADSLFTGGMSTHTMNIANTGGSNLEFDISTEEIDVPIGSAVVRSSLSVPRSNGDFPRGTHVSSAGPAPQDGQPAGRTPGGPNLATPITMGGSAFATESDHLQATQFSLNVPEVLNFIGPAPDFVWAGDFGGDDNAFAYAVNDMNQFMRIDTLDGTQTVLGTISPYGSETFSGMALDPTDGTMYAASTNVGSSSLYIIDVVAVTATRVGPIGTPGIISLAVDNDGNMFAHDIVTDELISIDKTTGTGTPIGSLGFDANFGQGMAFDPVTEELYLAAFNNYDFQAELRVADRATGATALVGVLGSITPGSIVQLGWIGLPGLGGVSWLALDPETGIVPPGASMDIEVVFDAAGLFGGNYFADIVVENNDPLNPEVAVPAYLNVTGAPDIDVSETMIDYGQVYVGAEIPHVVTVTNAGTDVLTVGGIASSHADFTADVADMTLPPMTSQDMVVTFAPSTVAPITGTLTMTTNDPDDPVVEIALQGEGLEPPVISVTPSSLADSLFTGGVSTQVLNIANSGGNPLDFEISVEPVDGVMSTVDVIADVSLPGDVIKRGRPLAADELAELKEKFPQSVSVNATGAIDRGTTPVKRRGPATKIERVEGPMSLEEVFGNDDNQFSGSNRGRGNLFTCTTTTTLIEHRLYLNPAAPTQMWFLVYESTAQIGAYDLISASDVSPAGPGLGWYSSGDIDIDLVEGRYYLIIATWEQSANYYNQQGISPYPIPASFGELTAGAGWGWAPPTSFPPGTSIDVPDYVFGEPVAYYQTLVTGSAVHWLSLDPEAGSVLPMESLDVEVTFDAAGMIGGDYEAEIWIANNDPLNPEVIVPVDLHVEGAPDITVSDTLLDYGPVFVGATATDTIIVSNAGTDVLVVSDISASHGDYTVNPSSFSLIPGEARAVDVSLAPSGVGSTDGILTLTSNDPDEGTLTVDLQGEGVEPPVIVVTPTSLADSLVTGGTSMHALTIANTGGHDLEWGTALVQTTTYGMDTYTLTAPVAGAVDPETGEARDPGDVRTTPITATLRDLTGTKILWDRAHGQQPMIVWSVLISDLTARGAIATENFGTITPAVLADCDVLWLTDYMSTWTASEIEAVQSWLLAGGGLIFECDESLSVISAVLSGLGSGITYQYPGALYGPTTNIYAHEMTAGVTLVNLPAPQSQLGVFAPAGHLVDDAVGQHVCAYSEVGSGRIFAVSDEIFNDGNIGVADHQLFGNQMVDWVASSLGWLALDPTEGTVAPGDSQTVEVTFDAAGLFGGDYSAEIVIANNDPLNPEVGVTADLNVTGAPDIAVSDTLLDYGTVFVGGTAKDTLAVSNAGTDALIVSDVSSSHGDYAVDPTSFTLDPGETQPVEVSLTPSTAGPVNGSLTLTSNDPDDGTLVVALSGEGVNPPVITVTPDSLADSLFTGNSSIHTLTVSNAGSADLVFGIVADMSAAASSPPLASGAGLPPFAGTAGGDRDGPKNAITVEQDPTPNETDPTTDPIAIAASYEGDHLYFGISDYGEIMPFQYPVANEHLMLGSYVSGYTLAYRVGPNSYIAYAAYRSHTNIEPVSYTELINDPNRVVVEVVTQTMDGRITITRVFTFERNDKYIGIRTRVENTSGGTLNDVMFKCYADWDVDGSASSDNWDYSETLSMVYAWQNRYTGIGSLMAPDLMDIDGWDDYLRRETFVDFPTGPVLNYDGLEVMHYELGDFDASHSVDIATAFAAGDDLSDLEQAVLRGLRTWLAIDPTAGVVPPGGSMDIEVVFDADGLDGGDYHADIVFNNNDPLNPEVVVPANLHVTAIPNITLSDSLIDFGPMFLGASQDMDITVFNTGNDVLIVHDIMSTNPDVTVAPSSFTVPMGQQMGVTVTFAPSVPGAIADSLTISSNDPDEPEVTVLVAGEGIIPPDVTVAPDSLSEALLSGETSTQTLTIANAGGSVLEYWIWVGPSADSTAAAAVSGSLQAPDPPVTPGGRNPLPQGSVGDPRVPSAGPIRDPAPLTPAVQPAMQSGPTRRGVHVNAEIQTMEPQVSWLSVSPTSGTVNPGNDVSVSVDFDAAGLLGGIYEAVIVITTNVPAKPEVNVPVVLDVTGVPAIAVSDTLIDFGTVYMGYPKTKTFTVHNTGTDDLEVSDISADDPSFSVSPASFTLTPTQSAVVSVTETPAGVGAVAAVLTITNNDPARGTVEVDLVADVLDPPIVSVAPDSFVVSLSPGEIHVDTLYVSNVGGSGLTWTASSSNPPAAALPPATSSRRGSSGTPQPAPNSERNGGPHTVESLATLNILWHGIHGLGDIPLWSIIISDLTSRGATVTQSTDPITAGLLAGTDIIWFGDRSVSFTTPEKTALADWLAGGGAILIEADSYDSYFVYNELLDDVGSGIVYWLVNGLGGNTPNIHPHETTVGVETIFLLGPDRVLSTTLPSAGPLIDDLLDHAVVAYDQVGDGRIVVMSDHIFHDVAINQVDNRLFANQVFNWFGALDWLSVTPPGGSLDVGETVELEVTIDATVMLGGSYQRNIDIASNDPATPVVTIPVLLSVDSTVSVTGIAGDHLPTQYTLHPNYPNPFNPTTTIAYEIPERAGVSLVIYDVGGREVRRLVSESQPRGRHEVTWDGRNASGDPAASGVYFYRLAAGDFVQTRKMILLK